MNKLKDSNVVSFIICLVAIVALLWLPTGFEKTIYVNAEHVKVKIRETNESGVYTNGLIKQGNQVCVVEPLEGTFKGQQVEGVNLLTGKLEFDTIFVPGDRALAMIEKTDDGELLYVNLLDYYRINVEWLLVFIFMGALILFSGTVGVRTIISFVFSLLCIWKILVPTLLKGWPPIFMGFVIGISMAIVTLLFVGGFTKKSYCAILGTVSASFITCILAIAFGNLFKIHGSVMAWSESLLYAGFQNLNLTQIYQAAIYLSCSGALVDLSIDISAAIEEVVDKKPDISKIDILKSGINIGRSVVGSQATTLLLAYMGSFITVMMVYMAQGTPMISILNSKLMASEILQTFVGCLGLVIVSPLTAVICSYMYKNNSLRNQEKYNKDIA